MRLRSVGATFCALLLVGLTGVVSVAPSASAAQPRVDWSPCSDDAAVECGTLAVPLDYADPHGTTITLALERRPADDPTGKIGTLFVNPGGPGLSGRHEARNAALRFGPDVLAHFDVIGFDPRGVGQSTPLQCFASNADAAAVLSQITDVPLGEGEISNDLAAFRAYTSSCGTLGGPIKAHMSTLNVARDLEVMRRAVGDRTMNLAAYSYGTLLGATYANLYPGRVRAMILDGPEDVSELTSDRVAHMLHRAGGFESTLHAVLAACQQAATACPFYGDNLTAQQKFDRLRERLRTGPLSTGTSTVTISSFTDGISNALFSEARLVPLTAWFQQLYTAAFGSTTATRAAVQSETYKFNFVDAWLGTYCVDGPVPRDQSAYPPLAETFELVDRTFARWQVYGDAPCATYPVTNEPRYSGPWDRHTAAPVLVVAQTHDPATPYSGALRLMTELANARLLTVDGYGHPSQNSTCVAAARDSYLLTLQLPPPGTHCAQDTDPFPG